METILNISDDGDRSVFESLGDELVNKIILIKHNAPNVEDLYLDGNYGGQLDERACVRLGHILGQSTHLTYLMIEDFNLMDMPGLCEGLQNNQCIRYHSFIDINLRDTENMSLFAPFLSHNPSLNEIDLTRCNLTRDGLNILADALANRLHDTIETLDVSGNSFADFDLDGFVEALSGSASLRSLWLDHNEIGQSGCTSLARQLENEESNLKWLYLSCNSIDDNCVVILAGSLTNNTKLKMLGLDDNRIGAHGWSAMLKLVCNRSTINGVKNSNHTLCDLRLSDRDEESVKRALGADNANLLHVALSMNQNGNKMLVSRRKMLWSHARGDINLGDSDIATGAMPSILAWIGNGADEDGIRLIQYHKPPLPESELGPITLDSVYRILRRRPDLCNTNECAWGRCQKEANSTHLWTKYTLLRGLILLLVLLFTRMSLTLQLKLECANEL